MRNNRAKLVPRHAVMVIRSLLATFLVSLISTALASGLDDAKAGQVARSRGNKEEALRLFTRAIRSGELSREHEAITYNNRGSLYAESGMFDLAVADFLQSIRLRPDPDVYYNLATTRAKSKQYDKAIIDYTEALRILPEHVRALNGRGLAYAMEHQYEKAIADFSRAVRLEPSFVDPYISRGLARSRIGQHQRAIADYNKALQLEPDYARTYRNRGVEYFALGQFRAAIMDFERFLEIDPSDAYIVVWLYTAHSKLSRPNQDRVKQYANKVDLKKWPGPLVSLFLEQSTVEQTRSVVLSGDSSGSNERQCEADFFIGAYELSRRRMANARSLFERVAKSCVGSYEQVGAIAELKRIGK